MPQYCSAVNSYSDNRRLVFHEDVPLAGTSLSLHYASNRVRGWKHVVTIPASGETVPEALKEIVVQATVAGRDYHYVLPPEPNAAVEVSWDGLDFRGDPVPGMAPLNYRIGFVYDTYYWQAWEERDRAFAEAGTEPTQVEARDEFTIWRAGTVQIYATGDIGTFGNGWTLSAQHQQFAGAPQLMFAGDGSIRRTPGTSSTLAYLGG